LIDNRKDLVFGVWYINSVYDHKIYAFLIFSYFKYTSISITNKVKFNFQFQIHTTFGEDRSWIWA